MKNGERGHVYVPVCVQAQLRRWEAVITRNGHGALLCLLKCSVLSLITNNSKPHLIPVHRPEGSVFQD